MSQFVLDASVVLCWCFPDENAALARQVADKFRHGDSAAATSFWPHEVLNALLVGERRKRISSNLVRSFLADLVMLPITLSQPPTAVVFNRIQSLGRTYELTAYDAAYLDLALENGLPLATLDTDLVSACKKSGVSLLRT